MAARVLVAGAPQPCADARRDRVLASAGYSVLRVTAQDVLSALPQVVARIRDAIAEVG